jgi:hypothetical protein
MQEFSYLLFHNPVGCLPISLSVWFCKITLHPFQASPPDIGFSRAGFHGGVIHGVFMGSRFPERDLQPAVTPKF